MTAQLYHDGFVIMATNMGQGFAEYPCGFDIVTLGAELFFHGIFGGWGWCKGLL